MANLIETIGRAAELTATLVKEYVDGFLGGIETAVDQKLAAVDGQLETSAKYVDEQVQELKTYVDKSTNTFTVDDAVTAEGANAVSGAAVADYVTQQINAITDYEGAEF